MIMKYFFFSSRRRHTRLTCDWSSDVCSSDLTKSPLHTQHVGVPHTGHGEQRSTDGKGWLECEPEESDTNERHEGHDESYTRSEERRVGKECRCRWSPAN